MAEKQLEQCLLDHLHQGATMEAACKAAKVDPEQVEQRLLTDKDFACEVAHALGQAEIAMLKPLCDAAKNGDWRAAAWWLERRGQGFCKDDAKGKSESDVPREVVITIKKAGRVSSRKKPVTK